MYLNQIYYKINIEFNIYLKISSYNLFYLNNKCNCSLVLNKFDKSIFVIEDKKN